MNEQLKLKRTELIHIIKQAREMRTLLEQWPAREIQTDFEKEWNIRRERLLNEPTIDLLRSSAEKHEEGIGNE